VTARRVGRLGRILGAAAAIAVSGGIALSTAPARAADGTATIDHAELHGTSLQLLVSVPGDAEVDLGSVQLSIDGTEVPATAAAASSSGSVQRTAVLAIDTSDSMAGQRLAGAKEAANTFLDQVPANVKVGIVTFDSQVNTRLEPTLDRSAAHDAVDALTLSRATRLYDGVLQAVSDTGTTGQRQVLLLSDGKDTSHVSEAATVASIKKSGVRVDAVSLLNADSDNTALAQLSQAGAGELIDAAKPGALASTYAHEAQALARQVLVTAAVPDSITADEGTAAVTLTAAGKTYSDSAFVRVRKASSPTTPSPVIEAPKATGSPLSWPIAVGAILAVGLGLGGIVLAAGSRPAADVPTTLEEQVDSYGRSGSGTRPATQHGIPTAASIADQAKDVAGKMLASNRSLEERIAHRLEAADLSLRPAEWLLIHAGVAVGAGLVGGLLGRGNPLLLLIFLALGILGPWLFLGLKKASRLKAFNAGLADTLQLLASSLSAGLSLAQSIDTVVREGTEPIASEFRRVIVESRLGVGLEDALEGVAKRMDSRDFAWVVMAVRIQREVGGNLAELLNTVAATLREREYLRRHVAALSAEGRLSAWILGALPPVFLIYLTLSKPDYVHTLYTTPLGILMCIAMAVLLTVGVFWMSKVAKVDV